jgi:hypothetical protein
MLRNLSGFYQLSYKFSGNKIHLAIAFEWLKVTVNQIVETGFWRGLVTGQN